MTTEQVEGIIDERFGLWKKRLMEAGAIPEVLIAVNLDTKQSVVCIPEKMPDQQALALLVGVASQIDRNMQGYQG